MSARKIDHVVLPTASLEVARARLGALGFSVAPDGIHPFGTANCCVYLGDGSFLEPLAVRDAAVAAEAASAGNVFVARDLSFRRRNGEEGASALVFATTEAEADHRAFVAAGISAGQMLTFSRPMVDAGGNSGTATFRLAFAGDPVGQDTLFFTCERVCVPSVDRASLERHDNGVLGLTAVAFGAQSPQDWATLINGVSLARVSPVVGGGTLAQTPNGVLFTLDAAELEVALGVRAPTSGLQIRAVCSRVADIATTADLLSARGVIHHRTGNRLVVPPAPGQGAIFAFEERP